MAVILTSNCQAHGGSQTSPFNQKNRHDPELAHVRFVLPRSEQATLSHRGSTRIAHGSLVVTATANPLALDARQKFAPVDELDLDQSYPGRPDGFTTE